MDENWDTCKENVQPLRQGRKVKDLGKFLSLTSNPDELKEREEKRREFEDLLRCDNEDPLAIWYDYINWVEQNYPEGGEEANLKKLIENCISELFNDKKYHQDERFFRIFLRYTRIVTDALELFSAMFSSNIFTSIASFYINWANVVEKNLKKAEEIIRTGLDKLAQPTVQLELALKEIQLIVAEHGDKELSEEEEDVRKPFVPLKVEKKKSGKALAPVERIANYEQGNFKLSNNQQSIEKRSTNAQIQIFTDENGSEPALANQQEIINKLPSSNNQENDRKAGRWCDNKLKSKSRIAQTQAVKFDIYDKSDEDEDKIEIQNDLESKPQNCINNKLKEIKKDEKSPRLVIFEKLAPNQRFYCDLKKIYCGGTEYSFEEIRSIRLKLSKKKEERMNKEKLKKEIEDLKKKISARENLVNDVEEMKKKLELLLGQNPKTKLSGNDVATKSNIDANADQIEKKNNTKQPQHSKLNLNSFCTSEKQSRMENSNTDQVKKVELEQNIHDDNQLNGQQTSLNSAKANEIKKKINFQFNEKAIEQKILNSPQTEKLCKEDLTIVRNLFNGSIDDENTVDIDKEIIKKPETNDFSIFKDDDNFAKNNLINFDKEDTNTFVLPKNDLEFNAKASSTPAHFLINNDSTIDQNCTIDVYQNRENKFLSPITEYPSKEYIGYKSSSSSSLSGFSSLHKSKTYHK